MLLFSVALSGIIGAMVPVGCGLPEPALASVTSCLRSGERASKPNHAPKHVTGRGGRDERSQCFEAPANLPSLPPTLDTFGLRLSSVTDREHRGAASLEIFSNLFRRREEHEQGGLLRFTTLDRPAPLI